MLLPNLNCGVLANSGGRFAALARKMSIVCFVMDRWPLLISLRNGLRMNCCARSWRRGESSAHLPGHGRQERPRRCCFKLRWMATHSRRRLSLKAAWARSLKRWQRLRPKPALRFVLTQKLQTFRLRMDMRRVLCWRLGDDDAGQKVPRRTPVGPHIDYLERAFDAAKYGHFSPPPYMDITIPS